jgi:phage FluMu protein Com
MKVSCPNCQKVLQAPDDWAGRKVKCPGCKGVIALPAPSKNPAAPSHGLDLGSLGAIEDAGQVVYAERKRKRMTLAEAQAAQSDDIAGGKAPPIDPTIRTCPGCGQKVKSDDIYSELECRNCGAGIPGIDIHAERARYTGGMADRITTQVSFYTGFGSAFAYPIPALVWILMGMGIALATIAIPLLGVLGFTAGAGLNPIAGKTDFGWVGIFLTVMFAVQGVYFGSVAYYVMIDTIRTTTSGGEQPPSLTWNVANLGAALAGYIALIGFYLLIVVGLLYIANGRLPASAQDLGALGRPGNLIILALLTFGVPMNMIGLSSSHALDGLNPVRSFRSIGRIVGHYMFLFLIMMIYLGIYIGGVVAVMNWAAPTILSAAQQGMNVKGGILTILLALLAWSVLIGLGFYFAYLMGRILGLFSRTYREQMDFDL